MLKKPFKLGENKTTVKAAPVAGLTTSKTMAYASACLHGEVRADERSRT